MAFVLLMVPVLCLPSVTGSDLTPDLMNWTCLVWGAPMLGVTIWWVVDAHKWFTGPKVNVEHAIHAADAAVIDGVGADEDVVQDDASSKASAR